MQCSHSDPERWQWVNEYKHTRHQIVGRFSFQDGSKNKWFLASGNGYLENIPPRFGEKQLLLDTPSWIERVPPHWKKRRTKLTKFASTSICSHLLTSVPGSRAFPTNLSKTPSPKKKGPTTPSFCSRDGWILCLCGVGNQAPWLSWFCKSPTKPWNVRLIGDTPWKFTSSPLKISHPKKESNLPTTRFHGLC